MENPILNYAKNLPNVNYLYEVDNGFVGYKKKLSKKEKKILQGKLIWKQKKTNNT